MTTYEQRKKIKLISLTCLLLGWIIGVFMGNFIAYSMERIDEKETYNIALEAVSGTSLENDVKKAI